MSGIYIHIPFCESKCSYCDFASFANQTKSIENYFQALYREIELQAKRYSKDYIFETVYFGGGTPSFVNAKYIQQTMHQLTKYFRFAKDKEMTIEMNPNSITLEKINVYKSLGFNRFSVGLQTAIDSQLKAIGRVHTLQDFKKAAELLKGENFNVDIMIGLKNQKLEDILYSIDQAILMGASHISVYALTPEENTPIYKEYQAGLLPNDEEVASFYQEVVKYLQQKEFFRYEVSNFSKTGKESKHNLIYWQAKEYLGLGLSASSYMQQMRFTNSSNLKQYIDSLEKGKLPIVMQEKIDKESARFEYIMLALRLTKGLNLAEYNQVFQEDFAKEYATVLQKNSKYLKIEENRVAIKEQYLYVQNHIILDFMKE